MQIGGSRRAFDRSAPRGIACVDRIAMSLRDERRFDAARACLQPPLESFAEGHGWAPMTEAGMTSSRADVEPSLVPAD